MSNPTGDSLVHFKGERTYVISCVGGYAIDAATRLPVSPDHLLERIHGMLWSDGCVDFDGGRIELKRLGLPEICPDKFPGYGFEVTIPSGWTPAQLSRALNQGGPHFLVLDRIDKTQWKPADGDAPVRRGPPVLSLVKT